MQGQRSTSEPAGKTKSTLESTQTVYTFSVVRTPLALAGPGPGLEVITGRSLKGHLHADGRSPVFQVLHPTQPQQLPSPTIKLSCLHSFPHNTPATMQRSVIVSVLLLLVAGCCARELRQAPVPKVFRCPKYFFEAAENATKSPKYTSSVAASCTKSEWWALVRCR